METVCLFYISEYHSMLLFSFKTATLPLTISAIGSDIFQLFDSVSLAQSQAKCRAHFKSQFVLLGLLDQLKSRFHESNVSNHRLSSSLLKLYCSSTQVISNINILSSMRYRSFHISCSALLHYPHQVHQYSVKASQYVSLRLITSYIKSEAVSSVVKLNGFQFLNCWINCYNSYYYLVPSTNLSIILLCHSSSRSVFLAGSLRSANRNFHMVIAASVAL